MLNGNGAIHVIVNSRQNLEKFAHVAKGSYHNMSYRYAEGFKHTCENHIHFATNEDKPIKWCRFCWCGFDIMRDTCPCCNEDLVLPDPETYDIREKKKPVCKCKCEKYVDSTASKYLNQVDFHYCTYCRQTYNPPSRYCICCDMYLQRFKGKEPRLVDVDITIKGEKNLISKIFGWFFRI